METQKSDFEKAIDKIKRQSTRFKEREKKDKNKWDRIATQKVGKAVIDSLLGINSIHKLELLDIVNHFQLGESGSFEGIKYVSQDSPKFSGKAGVGFVQG